MERSTAEGVGQDPRDRIIEAGLALLARDALTTRAVAAAAGVQAPTIYSLFGDEQGLGDALREHGFASYLRHKPVEASGADPVDELRAGWDAHVGFGLANPTLFAAMRGSPRPGKAAPAAARSLAVLRERMRSLARAGRLRVDEGRAADLVRAACGVVLVLLETPAAERDPELSAAAREAVLAVVATGAPARVEPGPAPAAATLRAFLPEAAGLTPAERSPMAEWLDRIARSRSSGEG